MNSTVQGFGIRLGRLTVAVAAIEESVSAQWLTQTETTERLFCITLLRNCGRLSAGMDRLASFGNDPFDKPPCRGCSSYLMEPYIKCAECGPPPFLMCLQCFARGFEYRKHHSDHKYEIMTSDFPILDSSWTAQEEMALLEAVMDCGFGNWQDVANQIRTKTKEECEKHYMKHFINNPLFSSTLLTLKQVEEAKSADMAITFHQIELNDKIIQQQKDLVTIVSDAPVDLFLNELIEKVLGYKKRLLQQKWRKLARDVNDFTNNHKKIQRDSNDFANGQVLAWPRDDHSNNSVIGLGNITQQSVIDTSHAAVVGSTLTTEVTDVTTIAGDQEALLSLQNVQAASTDNADMTKHFPAGGAQRKDVFELSYSLLTKVLRDMQLITIYGLRILSFFLQEFDNYAEWDLRDIDFVEDDSDLLHALKIAVVEIYHSRLKERQRRKKIIRDHGLISLRKFQILERRYPKEIQDLYEILRRFARILGSTEHDKFIESHALEFELRKEIRRLQEYRAAGIQTFCSAKVYEHLKQAREEARLKRTVLSEVLDYIHDSAACQQWLHRQAAIDSGQLQITPISVSQVGRRSAPPLNLTGLPGTEKLNDKEKELCQMVRLVPGAYLEYKSALVSECEKLGGLRLAQARALIKIDVNKTRKIYDFLIREGYISKV
ncbi:transcriptional adapter 2-alpha [Protopterus annectens]|uniref:transcriptional adapter 2-alpha n=1 Tax=Protopterus annectens TaxID=7888 RepID=UPI001CFC330D|nr:transcriptional adapter 2-alpha [Protopterus annectens]